MFPLRARQGGVLVRSGQTEAAVDLARLAGLRPGGVICEVMNDDGSMARVPHLVEFCRKHGLKLVSVAELIRYRMEHERLIRRSAEGALTNELGRFRTYSYASSIDPETHLALVFGDPEKRETALVRMHSRCTYGDVFGSTECECKAILHRAMERIVEEGAGVLVYLHQTGPGIRQIASPEAGGLPQLISHTREYFHYKSPAGQRLAPARDRRRSPDPVRPGAAPYQAADQPPPQGGRAGGFRHRNHRAGARVNVFPFRTFYQVGDDPI